MSEFRLTSESFPSPEGKTGPEKEGSLRADLGDCSGPVLELTVRSSTAMLAGALLRIWPDGYEHSRRSAHDGSTYFGSRKKLHNETVNDIVLPLPSPSLSRSQPGRHFSIQYSHGDYYLQDLGTGFGCFVKADGELELPSEALIAVGDCFVVTKRRENNVHVKVFTREKEGGEYEFRGEEYRKDRAVTVGRGRECAVQLPGQQVSMLQCELWWEGRWVLRDGGQGRRSTNGTWLYASEAVLLRPGLRFKSLQTVFEVTSV